MRTTLNLDSDVLKAAKSLAASRATSLGKVISDLVRKGLEAQRATRTHRKPDGFPVFSVDPGASPITLEDVRRDEDEG